MHVPRHAALLLCAGATALAACSDSGTGPEQSHTPPTVEQLSLEPNPNDALALTARVRTTDADSLHLAYWTGDGTGADAPQSPPDVAASGTDSIAILGLTPGTTYHVVVQARSGGLTAWSDTITATTGELPPLLASTRLAITGTFGPGYVLTVVGDASTAYAVAFDSTGRVRWYRGFAEGLPGGETKQQPNGDITLFLGATHGGDLVPGRYVQMHSDGSVVRTFTAPSGSYVDDHELQLQFGSDGAYEGAWTFFYTARHVDFSATGGPRDSLLTAHQIVHFSPDGSATTVFDAWDHFDPSENIEPAGGQIDFDHPNALDFDRDGNLIVSWRNLAAVTKIDAHTGALLWQLGGTHRDFTIVGDPLHGFSAQHSVRVLDDGDLLLFDNGTRHSPSESRAVEYRLDPAARTATMVWQHQHTPARYTEFTGSVQRLQNGNTLIGWTQGTPVLVTEVTPAGAIAWEGRLEYAPSNKLAPYRFTKIASLYRYAEP